MRAAIWKVTANGKDVASTLSPRLLSLEVVDASGIESDSCSIVLSDLTAEFDLPAKGTVLDIAMGWAPLPVEMGQFVIDELSISGPPDTIRITGTAANFLSTLKQKKSRDWHEIGLKDIVGAIASEHGLTPAVAEQFASFRIDHLDQVEESDIHLLTRLADQHGAIAKPVERVLAFVPRGEGKNASGDVLEAVSIASTDLIRWELTTPGRTAFASVTARWRNVEEATTHSVIVLSEVGEGPDKRLSQIYSTEADAKAAADAEIKAVKLDEARLQLTLPGRPDIAAGTPINVQHIRADIAGEWIVSRVRHAISPAGFQTDLESTRKS